MKQKSINTDIELAFERAREAEREFKQETKEKRVQVRKHTRGPNITAEQNAAIGQLLSEGKLTVSQIAKKMRLNYSSIYSRSRDPEFLQRVSAAAVTPTPTLAQEVFAKAIHVPQGDVPRAYAITKSILRTNLPSDEKIMLLEEILL